MQSPTPNDPQPTPSRRPPRSKYAERLGRFVESGLVLADVATAPSVRGRWAEPFRRSIGPAFDGRVILEIGCADGAFLATVAPRHPHAGFVGLDWKCKAIHDAAERAAADRAANLRFIRGRAQDLCEWFADGELDEIWIFHPDPCDRDVERPNRLFSESFLGSARRVLRDSSSRLCLKTDHAEYFQSASAVVADPSSKVMRRWQVQVRSENFWGDEATLRQTNARPFASMATMYESRFRQKRKPIYYLELSPR